jgi:hypothetical protein
MTAKEMEILTPVGISRQVVMFAKRNIAKY